MKDGLFVKHLKKILEYLEHNSDMIKSNQPSFPIIGFQGKVSFWSIHNM